MIQYLKLASYCLIGLALIISFINEKIGLVMMILGLILSWIDQGYKEKKIKRDTTLVKNEVDKLIRRYEEIKIITHHQMKEVETFSTSITQQLNPMSNIINELLMKSQRSIKEISDIQDWIIQIQQSFHTIELDHKDLIELKETFRQLQKQVNSLDSVKGLIQKNILEIQEKLSQIELLNPQFKQTILKLQEQGSELLLNPDETLKLPPSTTPEVLFTINPNIEVEQLKDAINQLQERITSIEINTSEQLWNKTSNLENISAHLSEPKLKNNLPGLKLENITKETKAPRDQVIGNWKEIKLTEHTGATSAVAISHHHDHEMIVGGREDGSVSLWSRSGELIQYIGNKQTAWFSAIRSITFSHDDQLILAGGDQNIIRGWKVNDGTQVLTLQGHSGSIRSLVVTPKLMVSVGDDQKAIGWNLNTGQRLFCFSEPATLQWFNGFKCVAISPDQRFLAVGGDSKSITVWDLGTQRNLMILEGHKGSVKTLAFTPDGNYLISGGADNTIRFWSLQQYCQEKCLKEHFWSVDSLAITPDGYFMVSGDWGGWLWLWDVLAQEPISHWKTSHGVMSVALSTDGQIIVAGCRDGIKVWSRKEIY